MSSDADAATATAATAAKPAVLADEEPAVGAVGGVSKGGADGGGGDGAGAGVSSHGEGGSTSSPSSPSSGGVAAAGGRLEGPALLKALKKQVEFYFSRQNLQSDGFLVSQMNAQMCVPVAVIAQFHKIQALTTDKALIAESVRDSAVCTVTPDGIKPKIKQERNTIILREIPSNTPPERVRELFTGEGMAAEVKSIRSDVGDTWFVTMDSEDDALNTILALRGKTFDGKTIKARLKSENLLRSFFPVPTAAEVQPTAAAAAAAYGPVGAGGMPMGPMYGMPGMGVGGGPPMMNGQPGPGMFGFGGAGGGPPGGAGGGPRGVYGGRGGGG